MRSEVAARRKWNDMNQRTEVRDVNRPSLSSKSAASGNTEALLVPASVAAGLCGVSTRSWWRADAAGRIPMAVKLGGRKLWRVAELRAWTQANCPPRDQWQWPDQ
jgi:predicted DNA-binding transcriptional regulator AlpA